jgi:hypothetical protein
MNGSDRIRFQMPGPVDLSSTSKRAPVARVSLPDISGGFYCCIAVIAVNELLSALTQRPAMGPPDPSWVRETRRVRKACLSKG